MRLSHVSTNPIWATASDPPTGSEKRSWIWVGAKAITSPAPGDEVLMELSPSAWAVPLPSAIAPRTTRRKERKRRMITSQR